MTPNFVSNVSASIALSCTCRGSGNLQEECEQLEESFSRNPCLGECAPPAPTPKGACFTQGEGEGQLCGPHKLRPAPVNTAAPSSAQAHISPAPGLGLSAFSHSLSDPKAAFSLVWAPGTLLE